MTVAESAKDIMKLQFPSSDFRRTKQTTFDLINSVINEKYMNGGHFALSGCY